MERKSYTEKEIEIIKCLYPDQTTRYIADMLGRSERSVFAKASSMGLRKSTEHIQHINRDNSNNLMKSGKAYRFQKGHTPANKGKKMSPETYERCRGTMFRKGHKPKQTKYDGAESVRTDKNGRRYIYVRIAEGKWIPKHIQIWTKAKGAVPDGHNIIFRDGNTLNCVLDNLECISDSELMKRNTIHNLPVEVQELIHLKGQLTRTINSTIKRQEP